MKRRIEFDTEGVASGCPISDIGTTTMDECLTCDWCEAVEEEESGWFVLCEKENDEPEVC